MLPWWVTIIGFAVGWMFAALFRNSSENSRYEEAFEYGRQYERTLSK